MMRQRLGIPVTLCGALWMVPGLMHGQDIEATAQVMRRTLPAGYYERIRQQPDFFEIRDGWIARSALAAQTGQAVSDTLPLLVILALFADSPESMFSSDDVQRVLFDGPTPNGTVSEFYEEVSGGRFGIGGRVLPWVRTSVTLAQAVGTSNGLGGDAQLGAYLIEALASADTMIDFGRFDSDGLDGIPNSGDDDGFVDALAFEFQEVSASCGGPGIWPHKASVSGWADSAFVTDDERPNGEPIRVNDYIIQSTVNCNGVEIQTATTIAHEMGHVLGLPDLYDRVDGILPEQRRWVIGCWSLMAAGAWGCGTQNRSSWVRPTHMGPWEKDRLGWLSEVQIVENVLSQELTLEPVVASGKVLKVPLESGVPADTNEYLLIEYRRKEGFDLDLPSAGVLIYHIDPTIARIPCRTCPKLYQVGLVEADANRGLVRTFLQGGNRGEPGDAFGAAGPVRFSNATTPSTRLNSGAASGVTFYTIAVAGDVARLTISTVTVALARLIERFVANAATPLSPEEEDYLDWVGNGNGRYDVGDLRAYLRR